MVKRLSQPPLSPLSPLSVYWRGQSCFGREGTVAQKVPVTLPRLESPGTVHDVQEAKSVQFDRRQWDDWRCEEENLELWSPHCSMENITDRTNQWLIMTVRFGKPTFSSSLSVLVWSCPTMSGVLLYSIRQFNMVGWWGLVLWKISPPSLHSKSRWYFTSCRSSGLLSSLLYSWQSLS